jgi:methionine-gamma-lyase
MSTKRHAPDTLCVHAGVGENEHRAVVPPIYQTSTFKFDSVEQGASLFAGGADRGEGHIYTRLGNPTVQALERALAELEGGFMGLACASGMAAIHTTFAAFLKAGDHVVCSESVYGPVTSLLNGLFARLGVQTTFVDSSDLAALKAAIRPGTAIVHIETPGNPTLVVTDLAAAAKLAHAVGARLTVDNTFMTPLLQRPLELGADVVMHSLTKFLNGHADVVGGVIVPKTEADWKLLRPTLNLAGGTLAPHDAFLVHRGLKTLALRMARHCASAQTIAEFLEKHPAVDWVRFPGLASDPGYALSQKQTSGPGGVLSFELRGGLEAGRALMEGVELAALAVSLGGVETLIQHPASMTHAGMKPELRRQAGITDGLVRLSVGIEDCSEILADLEQALAKLPAVQRA